MAIDDDDAVTKLIDFIGHPGDVVVTGQIAADLLQDGIELAGVRRAFGQCRCLVAQCRSGEFGGVGVPGPSGLPCAGTTPCVP